MGKYFGRYEDDRDKRRERIEYGLSEMLWDREMERARELRRESDEEISRWKNEKDKRYRETHTLAEYIAYKKRQRRIDIIIAVVVGTAVAVGAIVFYWNI